MGLLWLILCLSGYVICLFLAELNRSEWLVLQKFEKFSASWEENWKLVFDLPLAFKGVPLEHRKLLSAFKGMGAELADWSGNWGKLIRLVGGHLQRIIYRGCFTLIALLSAAARFSADFHVGKADTQFNEARRLAGLLNRDLTVSGAIALLLFGYGIWIDVRRYVALNIKSQKDAADKLRGIKGSAKTLLFLSSFELIRVLLMLACGRSGKEALAAAKTIFELPSKDQVFGIPVLVPILAFSAERRAAAFTLYQIYGPPTYWIFFGIVPLTIVSFVLFRRFWRWFRSHDTPGTADNWYAAAMLSLWIVLLGMTVAYRTGDLEDAAKITYSKTFAREHEKQFIFCERAAKGGAQDEREKALLACWAGLGEGWEVAGRAAVGRLLEVQSPKDQAVTKKRQAEWEASLANLARKKPREAPFDRVSNWRNRERELDDITNRIRGGKK